MINRMQKDIDLFKYAESVKDLPFTLGETDCNQLVLNVVDIYKGTDYTSRFKGKYKQIRKALRIAKEELGTSKMGDFLSTIATEIDVREVSTGDILVKSLGDYDACTICLGGIYLDANSQENVIKFNRYSLTSFEGFKAYRL